jgi:DNA recombination protein RmuC
MSSMEKQVGTVQNTIQKLGVRSRAIGRSLKDVASLDGEASTLLPINSVLPMLAAEEDA